MLPAVDGLLPEPHNSKLLTLFFRITEWHALAKLRMHTERTLGHLDQATVAIGQELRGFRDWSKGFGTVELPGEASARERRKSRKDSAKKTLSDTATSHAVPFQNASASLSKKTSSNAATSREWCSSISESISIIKQASSYWEQPR